MRKVLVSTIIVISFFCMSTFAFEGDGSKSNPYVSFASEDSLLYLGFANTSSALNRIFNV